MIVNGTANLSHSATVILVFKDPFQDTKRITLVEATRIVGNFKGFVVKNSGKMDQNGKCHKYTVASQDAESTSVSVLVVSAETTCEHNQRSWIFMGVTIGVLGSLVFVLGLLYVFRDIAHSYMRSPEHEEALVT